MLEAEFQTNIIQLAKTLGWLIHHDSGDMYEHTRGDPGFPDLVLAKDGRVIFLELKSDKGKATDAQYKWLVAIADSYLVRPEDMQWIAQLLGPNHEPGQSSRTLHTETPA